LSALRDSLRGFLQRVPPSNSQSWLAVAIQRWAETPEWASDILRLSPAERIASLVELAREAYQHDLGNLRSNLRTNTRTVARYVNQSAPRNWRKQHAEFLFVSLLDSLVLNDDAMRKELLARTELLGEERLAAAQRLGRGVLFLCCHQSHPGLYLSHPRLVDRGLTIVSHDINDANRGERRHTAAFGDRVEFAPTNATGARRMLGRLRSNGIVAVYNDFRFPESAGIPSVLFGRPVLNSQSLVNFVLRTRAPVLPLTVVRLQPFDEENVRIEILPELKFDDLGESERDSIVAAMRLGVATECMIRRNPVQWQLWTALEYRWYEARSAWSQLDRVFGSDAGQSKSSRLKRPSKTKRTNVKETTQS
jgi:lauroyl/myristoyl acyltransferase